LRCRGGSYGRTSCSRHKRYQLSDTSKGRQMNRLFYSEDGDNFKNFIIMSTVIHFSLALSVLVKGILTSHQTIIVPPSVRVDMVALPAKMTEAPAQKKPSAEPKKLPQKDTKENKVKDVKEQQKKAIEKLAAMNAIDKLRNEVRNEEKASDTPPAEKQYKGNIISSGNSFTGLSRLRVNDDLDILTSRIHQHWVLPQWLSDANLKASVLMAVDQRGHLIRREIYLSSGNTVFDSSCLAAIEQASPFDPPPAEVEEAHILIRFPFE